MLLVFALSIPFFSLALVTPAARTRDLLIQATGIVNNLTPELLENRIGANTPLAPEWLDGTWSEFLLALDDAVLEQAEQHGLRRLLAQHIASSSVFHNKPPPLSLVELGGAVDELEALLIPGPKLVQDINGFDMKFRKMKQVAAICQAVQDWFDVREVKRVVDVGAGVGALTRELQKHLSCPSVGIELRSELAEVARKKSDQQGLTSTSFLVCDVRNPSDLAAQLQAGDLVVGLHTCGRLGGDIVAAVAERASVPISLLMVSCCLPGWPWAFVDLVRQPQSALGKQLGLILPRSALKMANLGSAAVRPKAGRERLALRSLLSARGVVETQRMPLKGLRKQDFRRGFRSMASRALEVRGLSSASEKELLAAEAAAEAQLPAFRRLELLSKLVGDVVELAVNFDRGSVLEEAGLTTSVSRLFPQSISARNLAILAHTPS